MCMCSYVPVSVLLHIANPRTPYVADPDDALVVYKGAIIKQVVHLPKASSVVVYQALRMSIH